MFLRMLSCALVALLLMFISPLSLAEDTNSKENKCDKPLHISTVGEDDLLTAYKHIEDCVKPSEKLTVYVSGDGGALLFAQRFYDKMRTSGLSKRVRFESTGLIASASNIVWMAADERIIMPGSIFLLHRATFGAIGEDPELILSLKNDIMDSAVESVRRTAGKAAARLWEDSLTGKITGNTLKGEEAVKIGWATELEEYK